MKIFEAHSRILTLTMAVMVALLGLLARFVGLNTFTLIYLIIVGVYILLVLIGFIITLIKK